MYHAPERGFLATAGTIVVVAFVAFVFVGGLGLLANARLP